MALKITVKYDGPFYVDVNKIDADKISMIENIKYLTDINYDRILTDENLNSLTLTNNILFLTRQNELCESEVRNAIVNSFCNEVLIHMYVYDIVDILRPAIYIDHNKIIYSDIINEDQVYSINNKNDDEPSTTDEDECDDFIVAIYDGDLFIVTDNKQFYGQDLKDYTGKDYITYICDESISIDNLSISISEIANDIKQYICDMTNQNLLSCHELSMDKFLLDPNHLYFVLSNEDKEIYKISINATISMYGDESDTIINNLYISTISVNDIMSKIKLETECGISLDNMHNLSISITKISII